MPIFEFVCTDCGKPFEERVRNAGAIDGVTCPSCRSTNIHKKISTFASKVSGGSAFSFGSTASSGCSTGSV